MKLSSIIGRIAGIFCRKAKPAKSVTKKPREQATAERLQGNTAREAAKRARKAARVTRRVGR
ncbi:MAG: hypothetical protein V7668_15425 [Cereibacter changlensis]